VLTVAASGLDGISAAAGASSPSATLKAAYDAGKKKDTAALKKLISKDALKALENPTMPVDAMLEAMMRDLPASMPPLRNEKIAGTTATVEMQNEKTGAWEVVHFVKEEGEWKIALDKAAGAKDAPPAAAAVVVSSRRPPNGLAGH
jgi:hypothetical protein